MSASGTPGGLTRRKTDSAALLDVDGFPAPGVLSMKGVLAPVAPAGGPAMCAFGEGGWLGRVNLIFG